METESQTTNEQPGQFPEEAPTSQMQDLGAGLDMPPASEQAPVSLEDELEKKDPETKAEILPKGISPDTEGLLKTFYSKDWKETPAPTEAISTFQIVEKDGVFHYMETKADGSVVNHTERILQKNDEVHSKEHQEMLNALTSGGIYIKTSKEGVDIRELDREVKVEVQKEAVYATLYTKAEDGSVSIETRIFSPDPVEEMVSPPLEAETNTASSESESGNLFVTQAEVFSDTTAEPVKTTPAFAEVGVSLNTTRENTTSNFSKEQGAQVGNIEKTFGISLEIGTQVNSESERIESKANDGIENVLDSLIATKTEAKISGAKEVAEDLPASTAAEKSPGTSATFSSKFGKVDQPQLKQIGIELVSVSNLTEKVEEPAERVNITFKETAVNTQPVESKLTLENSIEIVGIALGSQQEAVEALSQETNFTQAVESGFVMPEVKSVQKFEIVKTESKAEVLGINNQEFVIQEVGSEVKIQENTEFLIKETLQESQGIEILEVTNQTQVETNEKTLVVKPVEVVQTSLEFSNSEEISYEAADAYSVPESIQEQNVRVVEVEGGNQEIISTNIETIQQESLSSTEDLEIFQENLVAEVENAQEAVVKNQEVNAVSKNAEVFKELTEELKLGVTSKLEKPVLKPVKKESPTQTAKVKTEVANLGIRLGSSNFKDTRDEVVKPKVETRLTSVTNEIKSAEVPVIRKVELKSLNIETVSPRIRVVERPKDQRVQTVKAAPVVRIREIKSAAEKQEVKEVPAPEVVKPKSVKVENKNLSATKRSEPENMGIKLENVSGTEPVRVNSVIPNQTESREGSGLTRRVNNTASVRNFNQNEVLNNPLGSSRGIVIDDEVILQGFGNKAFANGVQLAA